MPISENELEGPGRARARSQVVVVPSDEQRTLPISNSLEG